eukprot:XP_011665427.1 PREDICTED: trichohyalin-like [Strongylocentrotus purpuratus]
MASSNADLKTRISTLRHEILSYKPGKAVPCDDERVVFPDKLVMGIIDSTPNEYSIAHVLRLALYGEVQTRKLVAKRQSFNWDLEEYLTESISLILTHRHVVDLFQRVAPRKDVIQDFAGKVGCVVLLVEDKVHDELSVFTYKLILIGPSPDNIVSSRLFDQGDKSPDNIVSSRLLIKVIKEVTERSQLQWLDLIRGCLQEGDRVLAINELKEIKLARREAERLQTEKEDERARAEKEKRSLSAEMTKKLESKQQRVDTLMEIVQEKERNETTLRQQVEELKKEGEEDRARGEQEKHSLAAEMSKKLESKQHHIDSLTENVREKEQNETTLRQQVEELKNKREEDIAQFEKEKRSVEQLKREIWKLRTKIQLESEIRSAEQKKKTETPQLMQGLITWMNSGKQAHLHLRDNSTVDGRSETSQAGTGDREEPPHDEFADILQQIADDLSDEAKIDSLGGQLGIIQGDIQRALKTNMRFTQITSDGTRHMLKQWRRGVSREYERMEFRNALKAARLLNLAEVYFSQAVGLLT